MKPKTLWNFAFLAGLMVVSAWLPSGCSRGSAGVTKGVLYSVAYKDGDGKVHGFTRLNNSAGVPGGNGAFNVDAYGELTREFLILTRPQHPDLGPQVIPVKNLMEVQFSNGRIVSVNENRPAPQAAQLQEALEELS